VLLPFSLGQQIRLNLHCKKLQAGHNRAGEQALDFRSKVPKKRGSKAQLESLFGSGAHQDVVC
jgi:hypothetical protein